MIKLLVLCLLISCMACNSQTKQYESKLDDEQLARLMLDMHFGEIVLPGLSADKKDSIQTLFMKKVEMQYNLTASDIRQEIAELEKNPGKYGKILQRMVAINDSLR